MIKKKTIKCMCAILACILLFPAAAFAAEEPAASAAPSAELQTETVEEPVASTEPSAEPSETQTVEEPAASEETDAPQPAEEPAAGGDAGLDAAAVSEIKSMAQTDGAEAARMLFA
jgi:hypothetical protein